MNKKTFFGHPLGLLNLFSTEFCERFSYYGMRAILVFFICDKVTNGGLGLSETDALYTMSLFGSSVYLVSILGGYVADRILGSFRAVTLGAFLIAGGHVTLSLPFNNYLETFVALVLIAFGTGFLKPNVSSMVGDLYVNDERKLQAGFNLFVMGINLGSFFSPLITGYLSKSEGYHVAFLLPAIFIIIALVIYLGLSKHTLSEIPKKAPNPIKKENRKKFLLAWICAIILLGLLIFIANSLGLINLANFSIFLPIFSIVATFILFYGIFKDKSVESKEKDLVKAYVFVFVTATIFWAIEEMQSSVFALLAEERAKNVIFGFKFPAAWYQSINPLVIIILAPILAGVWQRWKNQPKTFTKILIGLVLTGVAIFIPAISFLFLGGNNSINPIIVALPIILFSVGELFVSPIGLSVTSDYSPNKYKSRMMSIWFLSNTLGQGINSFCVRFFNLKEPSSFFFIYTVVIALIIFGLVLSLGFLKKLTTR